MPGSCLQPQACHPETGTPLRQQACVPPSLRRGTRRQAACLHGCPPTPASGCCLQSTRRREGTQHRQPPAGPGCCLLSPASGWTAPGPPRRGRRGPRRPAGQRRWRSAPLPWRMLHGEGPGHLPRLLARCDVLQLRIRALQWQCNRAPREGRCEVPRHRGTHSLAPLAARMMLTHGTAVLPGRTRPAPGHRPGRAGRVSHGGGPSRTRHSCVRPLAALEVAQEAVAAPVGIYAILGASAASFAGTFFVAPFW